MGSKSANFDLGFDHFDDELHLTSPVVDNLVVEEAAAALLVVVDFVAWPGDEATDDDGPIVSDRRQGGFGADHGVCDGDLHSPERAAAALLPEMP